MLIARTLGIPDSTPTAIRLALLFYLGHLLFQARIGASQAFLALAVLSLAAALVQHRARLAWDDLYIPLGLYLLATTLSAALSETPLRSLADVGDWLNLLALPVGLTLYRVVPKSREIGERVLIALTLILSVWGIVQFFALGHRELEQRIRGPAAHVMTYSGILLLLALFSLALAFRRHRVGWHGSASAVASFALVLTLTRSAWLGWAAGFIVLMFLRRSRWFLFLVPILILAVTLSPLALFSRLVSSFDLRQSSNLDRIRMVQAGIEMIRDAPLFGVGPGNVKEVYPLYRAADAPRFEIPHLHNNLVQIWAERGVLAFAAYLFLIGGVLLRFLRVSTKERRERAFAEAGVVAVIGITVAGLFEFNFGDSEVLMTLLDLLALSLAVIGPNVPPGAANGTGQPFV